MKAIAAIIVSEDQESILLSRRSANEEDEAGKWENVGGKLEEDEDFKEAVIREVKEELGVKAKNIEEIIVYGNEDSDFCIKVYFVQIDGEPKIMEPEMCDEIKWFSISDLKDVDLASYTQDDFQKLNWINIH